MTSAHPAALPGPARLRLLQLPDFTGADGVVHALAPLDAAMLAFLVLQGPTPRATLASLLWPQRPQGMALTNLRQRLQVLRRWAPELLLASPGQVALGAAVRHDLQDPEPVLLDDPDALPGDLLGAQSFAATPELQTWVVRERSRWAARVRDALVQGALRHEAEGRIAQALRHADRLVRDEPGHEHGVRLLMRLHHRRGDRGAALAAYERCVAALNEQFGDAVSDETAQLAQAIARGGTDAPPPMAPLPVLLRHPPRLVSRERVLAAARQRWHDGVPVLLAGPAGIGKSRVFDSLCRSLPVTVVVRLHPEDLGGSLVLVQRLVQQLVETVTPQDGVCPAEGRTPAADGAVSLADTLTRLVRAGAAADRPLGIGIEDLHFADPESLALLLPMLPALPMARWLFCSRHRPFQPAVEAWLDQPAAAEDPVIELSEFDVDELAEFIHSLDASGMDGGAWATALQAHCGGNPLHVLQVLRAAHDKGQFGMRLPPDPLPQPAEVRDRIARRLDASDPLAQQLAFVAALAGVDFDVPLACRVLGRSVAELTVPWRRLEGLGILHGGQFSHGLMRQAVRQCVPVALVPRLRAEIAAALPDGDADRLERRAAHWEAAGEPTRAAADYARAADGPQAVGLPVLARALLNHAVRCHIAAGDAASAFDLRWRSGRLALVCASAEEALAIADDLLRTAQNDRQRCLAHCLLAQVHAEQHDAAALEDASRAMSLAAGLSDAHVAQQVQLRHAVALNLIGHWHEALESLEALDRLAEPGPGLREEDARELLETRLSVLSSLGRRREAVARAMTGRDQALAQGRWQQAAEMASTASVQMGYLCRPHEVIEFGEQALMLLQRAGVEHGYRHVDEMTLAGGYLDAGRFDDALRLGEQAATGLRAAGLTGWIANADNSLASMFMLLGRFDLAAQRLRDLPAESPTWARASRCVMQGVFQRRHTGRSPLDLLKTAWSLFEEGGALLNPFIRHRVALELATCLEPDEALGEIAQCEAWARSQQHVALARVAMKLRVEACLQAGRPADAAAAADALEADFGGEWAACNFYLPEMWQTLARAWDASDQPARADAAVAQALAWVQDREHHVPPVFLDSFRQHNPVNRWLLQRANRGFDHASITVAR